MSLLNDTNRVFIVVPAYNEEAVVRSVLQELLPLHHTIVVVDDGSSTELSEMVGDLPVYVLRHRVNLGQGAALQTGIEFALEKNAAYIITFDADGQHQAADIAALLAPLAAKEADITLGSRFLKNTSHIPTRRKQLLKFARLVNFVFTGLWLTDAHNGLRAMTANAARKIKIRQNGMAHATEIVATIRKKKISYREIPVTITYSAYSRNKGQTIWGGFRIFFDILLNKIFK